MKIKTSFSTLRGLARLLARDRYLLGASLFLSLFHVLFTLYIPILAGNAIDLIVGKGQVDFAGIAANLARAAFCIGAAALLQWAMSLLNNRIAYRAVREIRRQAFDTLQRLPLRVLDHHPHGDLVSRVISDADQMADGLLLGFSQLFSGAVTILATLVFMLSIDARITAAVVVLTPLSLFVARFIARRTYELFRRQAQVRGEQTAFMNEMVQNQRVVQAFSKEEDHVRRFQELNSRLKDCSQKAVFFSSLTNPVTRFINSVIYAAVALLGGFLAIAGGITVGGLVCFLSYANQYTKPFNEISGVITELQNALACADRLFEILREPVEEPCEDAAEIQNPRTVSLRDVSFSYSPQRPLIEHLELCVPKGSRVAIVGPTGCGKTTLINLILRFYDVDSGAICLDDTDIRKVTRHSLRACYGLVLQETWLKNGTVWENIGFGNPRASREEIVRAAKTCHAHAFIMRLPDGYDTVIGEEGSSLSEGEKQLLCIARAMLCEPSILILDEATSSVDTRTELKIQDAFGQLMRGKTAFIVAHRLSTVRDADVILVMRDGHVIEQGNHDELIAVDGFYRRLYESQFAG